MNVRKIHSYICTYVSVIYICKYVCTIQYNTICIYRVVSIHSKKGQGQGQGQDQDRDRVWIERDRYAVWRELLIIPPTPFPLGKPRRGFFCFFFLDETVSYSSQRERERDFISLFFFFFGVCLYCTCTSNRQLRPIKIIYNYYPLQI